MKNKIVLVTLTTTFMISVSTVVAQLKPVKSGNTNQEKSAPVASDQVKMNVVPLQANNSASQDLKKEQSFLSSPSAVTGAKNEQPVPKLTIVPVTFKPKPPEMNNAIPASDSKPELPSTIIKPTEPAGTKPATTTTLKPDNATQKPVPKIAPAQ